VYVKILLWEVPLTALTMQWSPENTAPRVTFPEGKAFFNTMDWAPIASSASPLKKKIAYCPKARALGPVLSK
jgi:hypothetical protein